jgi:hypothetical protein
VTFQGRGLGAALLADALLRTARVEMGVFAMIVDTKDDAAQRFYEKHGFTLLAGEQRLPNFSEREPRLPRRSSTRLPGSRRMWRDCIEQADVLSLSPKRRQAATLIWDVRLPNLYSLLRQTFRLTHPTFLLCCTKT